MIPARILCSACGFTNQSGARYCSGCARPLARTDGGGYGISLAAVQTPHHLAERILASRGALGGERKLVTVMFADVQGSLEIIGGRDAEQAQAILDALLRAMVDAVHRYEGTVNQILGDGIMAIFGAPIAHEDHAVRAACAALAIQEAMRGSAGSALEQLGVHPQVRIGLNSGVVVITAINNDLSLDYRAIGPTTHIASRMEQTASAGTIRLTRDTLRLTDGLVEAELLGQLAIKGVTDPVEVYELRRMSPGGTRFRTRVARGLSPMTGRAEEMELIAQMLREATAGQPHVIAIHGEPGVGKSRLCFEVTRSDPAGSFRVLECQASVQGPAAPYSAITALFRNYFGIVDTDSPAELTRRVLTNLTELGPALQAESAILLGLLDLASDQPEWQELDPASRKRRVFELARTFIRSICEMRPTLLILEDVHSLDAASLDFVDGLLQQPPAQALLVLLTSRTEMPNWTAPAIVRELSPLPAELADAMLRSLLGEAPGLAALRLRLVERTSGNPFFIEETLRSLLESGVLRGSSGHYELSKQHPVIDIPPTASALIASRIDALPPEVKALVQTAAVIGSEMAVDLLWRMSGLEENVLRERLASATESEVLYHIEVFPTSLCGFRHALTRDVAYESVLQSERRLLHARVVAVLEEVHRDRLTEHVERLAEHSYLGELWDKAVRYHIMAAARAASRFANQQAVDILDRGLRIVKRLPPDRARSEAEIDLRLAGLAALLPLGEKERISAMLFEAEATASEIGDQPRLAAIHSQIATALWILGQHEQARECAERALLIAARQGRFSLRLSARFGLIMAHHALGDLERCIDLTRDVLRELSGDREMSRFGWAGYPAILCRAFLASSLMLTGAFDDARVSLEQALQLAEDTGQPYSRVIVHHQMGVYYAMRAEYDLAIPALSFSQTLAREGEVRTMYGPILGWLAQVLVHQGRADEAVAILEEAFATQTVRLCGHYGHIYMLDAAALAQARLGRMDQALAYAQEAVDRTLAHQEHVHHGGALLRLGLLQAQMQPSGSDVGERICREALNHSVARRMQPLTAACHEALGQIYLRTRRDAAAPDEFAAAARLYTAMNLPRRAQMCRESPSGVPA